MREAGVNLVSVGIFSWARLEPRPGEYDFGWLDRVVDLLYENGVMVDLATATASPPPWLCPLHPESLPVTRDGVRSIPAPASTTARARRFRGDRAGIAERSRIGTRPPRARHVAREQRVRRPRPVLLLSTPAQGLPLVVTGPLRRPRRLNEAWGTAFWSQRYGEWGEIHRPGSADLRNPTQQLDYHRFSSDALLECYMEREVLGR